MSAEDRLTVRMLGQPRILWRDQQITIPRRLARTFIYYLACHKVMISRSDLVNLFWPDSPNSRQHLRDLLSKLRSELPDPDIIRTDRDWIGLNYQKVSSDVLVFEDLYEQLSLPFLNIENRPVPEAIYQKLLNAVTMWEAPGFLYGVALIEKDDLSEWVENKNRRLRFKWLNLMMRIARHLMAVGDLESALIWLEKVNENDEDYEFPQVIYNRLDVLYQLGRLSQAYEYGIQYVEEVKTEWFSEFKLPFARLMKKIENERLEVGLRTTPPTRSSQGSTIPFMGRSDLITQIQRAYRRGDIIVLSAETGFGKSRLLNEFLKNLVTPVLIYSMEALYSERMMSYHAMIELLRKAMNMQDWQQVEKIWVSQLSALMPELQNHLEHKTEYYSLIENRQLGVYEAFRQVLLMLAGKQKILICIENAQWLDQETVQLFSYLTHRHFFSENAQLILLMSKGENQIPVKEFLLNPAWNNQIVWIDIPPLSADDISNIALYLLRKPLSDLQTQQLMEATGGNPLFVIETLQMIMEKPDQLAQKTWESIPISGVVRIVIRERLGHLSENSKQLLVCAALVGNTFSFNDVQVMANLSENDLVTAIDELIHKKIIEVNSQQYQPLRYRFSQTFIREVVYQGVSQTQKQILHKRLANHLLISTHDKKNADDLAEIGYHLSEAGKIEEGFKYWIEAAEMYKNTDDYQKANHAYEQAHLLLQNRKYDFNEQQLFDLWVGWGEMAVKINDIKAATEYYQIAMREGLYRKSSLLIGGGLSGEGFLYTLRGFPKQGMQYLERASVHLKDGYITEYIRASVRKMLTHLYDFDLNASIAEFKSVSWLENQLKTEKDELIFASLQSTIAMTYMLAGKFPEAETEANKAIQTALKHNNPSIRVECEFTLGLGFYYQGLYKTALGKFGLAMQIAESNYYWRFALETLTVNSRVHLALGKTYHCWENIQNAQTLAKMYQHERMNCILMNAEGRLYVAFGEYEKAMESFQESSKYSFSQRDHLMNKMWISFCTCMMGDLDKGIQELQQTVAEIDASRYFQLQIESRARLGLALYLKGDIQPALQILKDVTVESSEIGFAGAGMAYTFVLAQEALKAKAYDNARELGEKILNKANQEESPWLEWLGLDILIAAAPKVGKTHNKHLIQKQLVLRTLNQSKPQNMDLIIGTDSPPFFALV